MEIPGPSPELPELKKLTAWQKANFIRQKLEHSEPYDTEKGWKELTVTLINPHVLTWQGQEGKPARLPPQKGIVIRTVPDGFLVDFTQTSQITDVDYAVFGPNAFEVTKDARLMIDCTKAETPKGGIQAQFPNFFVDKAEKTRQT